MAALTEH